MAILSPFVAPFVAKTEILTSAAGGPVHRLPDGTTTLIFRLLKDGHADLHVVGPRTQATYKRGSPFHAILRIVFRPGGGHPFFDVPLTELADRSIPVRDLWGAGADTLLDKLVEAGTNAQRLEEMERALVEKLRAPKVFEPLAMPVVTEALAQLGTQQAKFREVARNLNMSERNLRRVFSEAVGLSPKRYARIARFQKAIALASHGEPRWSEIAAESGYFDQAHMCADFRDLAQASPEAFLRKDPIEIPRHTGC